MTTPSSHLSLQVYAACKGSGLSLPQIADRSGVSLRTIQRMGKGRPVGTDNLEDVARAIGLRLTLSEQPPQENTP